jgi:hypothetical protein
MLLDPLLGFRFGIKATEVARNTSRPRYFDAPITRPCDGRQYHGQITSPASEADTGMYELQSASGVRLTYWRGRCLQESKKDAGRHRRMFLSAAGALMAVCAASRRPGLSRI